jgi:hypothetical protein
LGTDRLAGGSEIDKVYVTAAAVGGDTFTGGNNTANALVLTTPGSAQGCSTLSSEFPVEERIRSGESGSVSILTER